LQARRTKLKAINLTDFEYEGPHDVFFVANFRYFARKKFKKEV
jgi:hypothetical protein